MSTSSTFASFKVFSSSKSSISPPISSITAFVVVLAPSLFSPSSSLPKKPASFGGFGMFAKNPMMRRLSFFLLLLLARCFFLSRAAEREKADQNRRLSDVSFFSNSPFSSSEWKKKNVVFAALSKEERIKRTREKENALSRLLFCFFFFLCF